VSMTLDMYSHFIPDDEKTVIDQLDFKIQKLYSIVKKQNPCNSSITGVFGADNRTRTCMVSHWILSPACLPIPPCPHIAKRQHSILPAHPMIH
jgi:hypothetical protein